MYLWYVRWGRGIVSKNKKTLNHKLPSGKSIEDGASGKQETSKKWVWSLGQEDALEEGMATHSSIFAWRIPWTEEADRLWFIGLQRVEHDWRDLAHRHSWKSRIRREYRLEIGRCLTKKSTKRVERVSLWDADIEKEEQESADFVLLCFLSVILYFMHI